MKNTSNSSQLALVALVLSVVALVMCGLCCFGGHKGGADVEAVLSENPEIIVNAMKNYETKARENAAREAQKLIDDNMDALVGNPDSPVRGNPEGAKTVVEFFDYACGYCHRLFPTMQAVLKNNPDVKFVSKEVAFVSPHSEYAAKAAFAAKEQGKYEELHVALMESREPLSVERVDALAAKVGVDTAKMKEDINSDKVKMMMSDNIALAQKLQVNGVPTLVINGKLVQTLDEGVIEEALGK